MFLPEEQAKAKGDFKPKLHSALVERKLRTELAPAPRANRDSESLCNSCFPRRRARLSFVRFSSASHRHNTHARWSARGSIDKIKAKHCTRCDLSAEWKFLLYLPLLTNCDKEEDKRTSEEHGWWNRTKKSQRSKLTDVRTMKQNESRDDS